MEAAGDLHASIFRPHTLLASAVWCFALPDRVRTRERRKAADRRWAGRKRPRSRDKKLITLGRSRTTGHTSTRKGIPVGVRSRETVGERLQERDNLVFFCIAQTEITNCPVDIVRHLGPRPAVYFFDRSWRAVSGSNVEPKHVARVVEMDELIQALDVPAVKELLLKVRPGRLGGGTLWRCHSDIARRRHLHFAVVKRCKFSPGYIRAGPGTETASQESPKS